MFKYILLFVFIALSSHAVLLKDESRCRDELEDELGISGQLAKVDSIITLLIIPSSGSSAPKVFLFHGTKALPVVDIPMGEYNPASTIKELQIFVKEQNTLTPLHTDLSADIKNRILKIICEGRPRVEGRFECSRFNAFVMSGIYDDYPDFKICNKKRITHGKYEEINAGSSICFFCSLSKDKTNYKLISGCGTHYAIYLGKGFVISLYGSAGLRVTSLESTIKDYFCVKDVVEFSAPTDPEGLQKFLSLPPVPEESDEEDSIPAFSSRTGHGI